MSLWIEFARVSDHAITWYVITRFTGYLRFSSVCDVDCVFMSARYCRQDRDKLRHARRLQPGFNREAVYAPLYCALLAELQTYSYGLHVGRPSEFLWYFLSTEISMMHSSKLTSLSL